MIPGGGMALASSLGEVTNGKKITAVIGMMGDKQTEGYLSYVAPLCEEIVAVPVRGNPRSLPAGELARQAAAYCPNVSEMSDAGAAVETLASRAPECLLVCGSLYLAGEVREKLIEIFG